MKKASPKPATAKRPRAPKVAASPATPTKDQSRIAALAASLREVRARYDAAQTTPENAKHWAASDGLSALAANSRDVRRTLRNRSRYEVANNGYADGICQTLANDTIGTGPRLQVRTGDKAVDKKLEQLWASWAKEIGLTRKLWTMRFAKFEDGEAFGLLSSNERLRSKVKLDLRLVEAEQCSTPTAIAESPDAVDGIVFDSGGNPSEYHFLKSHPGDPIYSGSTIEYDRVSARLVMHYFRARRPGQKRGTPEITSALMLFGQLRRYTLAVIAAAEVAADFSLVIQSKGAALEQEGTVTPDAMDTIELEKRMATVLPDGWELGQAKPEQPTTTYGDFKRQVLTEIARPLNMPYNIAAGDSSSYNYASGRLDHQTYFKAVQVERDLCQDTVLDPLFSAWFDEAVRISGLLPQRLRAVDVTIEREWLWDGREHVDPVKEAQAEETQLRNNTTSLQRQYARKGLDWEPEVEQIARERKRMQELGLAPPAAPPANVPVTPDGKEDEEDDEE